LISLEIDGGKNGNTFNVKGTPAPTTIMSGTGNDKINLGNDANTLTGIAMVTVDGGTGKNILKVNDRGDNAAAMYSISASKVTVAASKNFEAGYTNIQDLVINGGSAGNTFKGGTGDKTNLAIFGGGGNDVLIGTGPKAQYMPIAGKDPILSIGGQGTGTLAGMGTLTIVGGAKVDLVINDQMTGGAQLYLLTSNGSARRGSSDKKNAVLIGYDAIQSVTFNGGNGDNAIYLSGSSAPTTVNGGSGNDTFNVGDSNNTLDGFQSQLTLNGGGSTKGDVLNINDQGNGAFQSYTIDGLDETVTAGNGPQPLITYTGIQRLTLSGSNSGSMLRVLSTDPGTSVTVTPGLGINTIDVGNQNDQLDNIGGDLTITDTGNRDTIDLLDQGGGGGHNYTIMANTFTREDGVSVTFSSPAAVTVYGGGGGYTWTVPSTPTSSVVVTTTLNLGPAGGDTVDVGTADGTLDFIGGTLNINGQGGNNQLVLSHQIGPPEGYGLKTTNGGAQDTFTRIRNGLQLIYSGIQAVTFNASNTSTIDLDGTIPGISITINGGGGFNALSVQNLAPGTVVTISEGAGGFNSFDVQNIPPAATVKILDGGDGGPNTLTGPDAANSWTLHDIDAGDINGNIIFNDIQNLVGGNGNDDFVFGPGAFLSGNLDGGAGFNVLDYSNDNPGGVQFTWFVGPPPNVPPPYSGAVTPLMGGSFQDIWDFNPEPPAGPQVGQGGFNLQPSSVIGENTAPVLRIDDHRSPDASQESRLLSASGHNGSPADPGSRPVATGRSSLAPDNLDALFGTLGDQADNGLAGLPDSLRLVGLA
jgi:hypothetical protein